MSLASLSQLAAFCERIGIPARLLGTRETGRALVVLPGGRILGLAAAGREANVLWIHPGLELCRSAAEAVALSPGGMGGLRLWQAPESALMWQGAPRVATFENYRVQSEMDPGRYAFESASEGRCVLTAPFRLADHNSSATANFSIRRVIELVPLSEEELPPRGAGAKLRMQHRLLLDEGPADLPVGLWHLLQLPAGTEMRVSLSPGATFVPYFNPERMTGTVAHGIFSWKSSGESQAKVGFAAASLRGGLGAVRPTKDSVGIFRWNIPLWPGAPYVDGPPAQKRADQVVQFWDGFGFCEVEYHSPACSRERPEILDVSELSYVEA